MADYLRPDVFVEEKNSGPRPIQGVGTSTAAFVALSPRGKIGVPQLVTSWTDYVNAVSYGLDTPFLANSYGAYAVYGFFNNGGTRAYIVRPGDGSQVKAQYTYTDGQATPADIVKVEALDEGIWGNKLSSRFVNGLAAGNYDFIVKFDGTTVATYKEVSFDATQDNFIETAVNGTDKFVSIDVLGSTTPTLVAGDIGVDKNLSGGADGSSGIDSDDLLGTSGLAALDTVDNINIVVIPESQAAATITGAYAWCEKRKDAFFVCDGALTDTVASIQTLRASLGSKDASLYYPWIEVSDPIGKGTAKTKFVPVAGHVAGVYARTDGTRGVYKAPAGIDATVRGALSTKVTVQDGERDVLNPKGINVIRVLSGAGIVVWGARTLGADPKDRYVNVRRGLKKIIKSLAEGSQWAVFEPNNTDTWRQMRVQANSFLLGEFKVGAFKGDTPAQAFFVKCDAELNTQEEVDAGRINEEVGVAFNKPGEFIIIRIGQWDGGVSVS